VIESIVPQTTDLQTKILTLLAHASLGRRLFPTNWTYVDSAGVTRCSCMQRERPDDVRICSRNKPGKHPRISQWQMKASCDSDQILEWHQWLPLANWGWLQDETFALDIDPKRGGLETLTQWVDETGGPETTLRQRTQSGGIHLIYRQPSNEQGGPLRVQGDVLPGIEIRGLGSYIMVDPSRGWTLENPDVVPVEADELTLALIAKHGIDPSLGDGEERLGVGASTGTGKKKSSGKSSDLPATVWFVQHGFGEHTGSRNIDAYRLAWRLLALGDRYPEMYTIAYITDVFRRCWQATDQGEAPFPWEECLGALQSAWKRREKQKKEDHQAQLALAASLLIGTPVGDL